MNSRLKSTLVIVLAFASMAFGACGSSCEPEEVPVTLTQDGLTLVATFASDVFTGSGEALLVTLRSDDEDLGRWQATAESPARGLIASAVVIDARTVEIELNGAVSSDADLRIRPDSAGPCDGPAGSAVVKP